MTGVGQRAAIQDKRSTTRSRPLHLIAAPACPGANVSGCDRGAAIMAQYPWSAPQWLQAGGNQVDCTWVDPTTATWRSDVIERITAQDRSVYRHLEDVALWCKGVYEATRQALLQGQIPVLLGGDHSLSIGSIAAVGTQCAAESKPLFVVWVDAHADVNTIHTTPTGHLHGMPVACLMGQGPPVLTSLAPGCAVPAVRPQDLAYFGVRSIDPLEAHTVRDWQLNCIGMGVVRTRGVSESIQSLLSAIPAHAHVHVSFDVDCLDPLIAPGVGTPVPKGLTLQELTALFAALKATGQVGSVDVVEFNPDKDTSGETSTVVMHALKALL